ncbi:MAG TPA: SAM-dependent methyltransferase [Desulfobacteraceae bacterium]|nr:SAM-dependent methyltransferase [Desulfobacteraceae bacterium]
MNKILLDFLICPACLPLELSLKSFILKSGGDDIISGHLYCEKCARKYPVSNGIAVLLPDTTAETSSSQDRYEEERVVSSYLWAHYSDLFHDHDANNAYSAWSSHFSKTDGIALDTGCAVGRFTFELGKKSNFAVGIDRSYTFVKLARKLAKKGCLDFPLPMEGDLTEKRTIILPDKLKNQNAEFIVADALALPFSRKIFALVSSLNLLDKVPKPLTHLLEINRVAHEDNAGFLLSDPFSWSLDSAKKKDWLGGKKEGKYQGNGLKNVCSILTEKNGHLRPPWNLVKKGVQPWKIRNHQNHYEMIRSQFIVASR